MRLASLLHGDPEPFLFSRQHVHKLKPQICLAISSTNVICSACSVIQGFQLAELLTSLREANSGSRSPDKKDQIPDLRYLPVKAPEYHIV